MSEITLDRIRIVRNAIIREWQKLKAQVDKLPERAESKERMIREMSGLKTALFEIHHEFDELEPIPMDQKPYCPFCGEEMDHPALADHMKEHLKNGHYPLVNAGSSLLDRVEAFGLLMERELEYVGWDGEARELLEGMANKLQELGLMKEKP